MVYLNWGHTITPSKLEAHLRFNWKSSLQHIQWPLHPQRKKSLVSLSLGFSAAPCAGFVALKTVPASAVLPVMKEKRSCSCLWAAVSWCTSQNGTAQENNWCFSSQKAIPAISWEIPLLLCHCKSAGRGKTTYFFNGRCTCCAPGTGLSKAQREHRFSCPCRGESLALFCSCC